MISLVYFATPDIAIPTFEYLVCSKDYNVLAVVSQPSKICKRGNKITDCTLIKHAKEYNIPVYQPEKVSKDENLLKNLRTLNPDFFVTFAFGQILSQEVIDIPTYGTVNIHASLLPEYRGANPIRQAILDGKKKTGLTTMLTCLKMDAGDICLQEEINIKDMNYSELSSTIAISAISLLDKTLKGLIQGKILPLKQDESKVTYCFKSKKEDNLIDWNTPAETLYNKIRALDCYTYFKGKRIKILKAVKANDFSLAGTICSINPLIIACQDTSLEVLKVQPEGKKEMDAVSWVNGARVRVGDRFEEI